jgi:hypothetical protein
MKIDNNKQTAVDWLIRKLYESIALPSKHIEEIKAKAKAMEKEQHIDTFNQGMNFSVDYFGFGITEAEQYYNETFGDTK